VQTAAFNLPNDERVMEEKGSKRVMLKNIQEAKFNKVLEPISKIVLDVTDQDDVTFEAYHTIILSHELIHGLGPHEIRVDDKESSVRLQLKEINLQIEEAKADTTGLFALQYLIDKGVVVRQMEQQMYTTYLASVFRSIRFGIASDHARAVITQFNYLLDEGAININESAATFSINRDKIKNAVKKLTSEILTIQGEGSYDRAEAMLRKYSVIRPVMQRALDKLTDVPVDIAPSFTFASSLSVEASTIRLYPRTPR
jgi:hypothetical protein